MNQRAWFVVMSKIGVEFNVAQKDRERIVRHTSIRELGLSSWVKSNESNEAQTHRELIVRHT